jgi:hypothetical protein
MGTFFVQTAKKYLIIHIAQPKDYSPTTVLVEVFAALAGLISPLSLALSRKGRGPGRGGEKTSSAKRNSTRKTIQAITQFSPLTPHG